MANTFKFKYGPGECGAMISQNHFWLKASNSRLLELVPEWAQAAFRSLDNLRSLNEDGGEEEVTLELLPDGEVQATIKKRMSA